MSSWWSIRHPLLINCLTTSKWPSADAFWSAVWPVWKKKKKSKLKKAFVLSNVWVFCSVNKLFSWSSSIFDHLYYCVLVWVVLKTDSSDQFLKKKINWDYFDVPIISVINTYMVIDFIWTIPYYLDFSLLQKYCKLYGHTQSLLWIVLCVGKQ